MYLDVNDEFEGTIASFGRMTFPLPKISVRDLIHERVRLEMERVASMRHADPATMDLTAEEKRLNSQPRRSPLTEVFLEAASPAQRAATRRHLSIAEEAFAEGRYFVLLNDRQADDLDEMIDLSRTTEATFLLLTPLKGG